MENKIYLKDLITKCAGTLLVGDEKCILDNFSKDTRTLQPGDIYVGIKGEVFNGNALYKEALEKGAKGCILDRDTVIEPDLLKNQKSFIVLVDDTIKCLQILASYKRSLYDIPVVGVTGSVGKTSTKDVIASVLGKKYKVLKTEGSYNNHIGLPLTILSLKDHTAMVIEMGMNALGEIATLSQIAKPTLAVITNVGTAHIGFLGSRENILKAKLEILAGMPEKVLVINNDNDMLHNYYLNCSDKIKFITYGIDTPSDYMASNIELSENYSKFTYNHEEFQINSPGAHFVLNALCALAVGHYFKIADNDIKEGISSFTLTKKRLEVEKYHGITIINDAFNANLDSMTSALNYLGILKNTRKVAILGDMLELGDYATKLHQEVGKCVYANKIDVLVTIGSNAKYIASEALKLGFNKENVFTYNSNEEANNNLKNIVKPQDTILIKASKAMHLNEVYDKLKEVI